MPIVLKNIVLYDVFVLLLFVVLFVLGRSVNLTSVSPSSLEAEVYLIVWWSFSVCFLFVCVCVCFF